MYRLCYVTVSKDEGMELSNMSDGGSRSLPVSEVIQKGRSAKPRSDGIPKALKAELRITSEKGLTPQSFEILIKAKAIQ